MPHWLQKATCGGESGVSSCSALARCLPSSRPAAITFWDEVAAHDLLGQVQVVFVDSSFNGVFREHLAQRNSIRVEKPAHVLDV